MKKWLKLVRWPNLLMMAVTLYLIRLVVIEPLGFSYYLDHWHFLLLVTSTVAVGAAAYIINDLYDVGTDLKNKPHRVTITKTITPKAAKRAYWSLTIFAVLAGIYLGWYTNNWRFGTMNGLISFLLYLYAVDFKARPLLGNVLVSFFSAILVTYPAFFDIIPATRPENAEAQSGAIYIMVGYAGFAFITNLIREIIKDLEDQDGDRSQGYNTLPIALGNKIAKAVVLFLLAAVLLTCLFFLSLLVEQDPIPATYVGMLCLWPVIVTTKLLSAKSAKDFHRISTYMKIFMLLGLFSMVVFTLSVLQ